MIARVNMTDGGGAEFPEDLLRNRVESEVSFPIIQIIPQLTPTCGIFRLRRSSGSKSTLLFLYLRSMHIMLIQTTRLRVLTSYKRGYVSGSNYF